MTFLGLEGPPPKAAETPEAGTRRLFGIGFVPGSAGESLGLAPEIVV